MGVAEYGYARQRFARHSECRNSVRLNLRCDEVASFMSGWMRRTEPDGTCWIVTWEDRAQGTVPAGSHRYSGSLFPFALNFAPNSVSGPPPLGFVWQSPQAFPVSCKPLSSVKLAWRAHPLHRRERDGGYVERTEDELVVLGQPLRKIDIEIIVPIVRRTTWPASPAIPSCPCRTRPATPPGCRV